MGISDRLRRLEEQRLPSEEIDIGLGVSGLLAAVSRSIALPVTGAERPPSGLAHMLIMAKDEVQSV